MILFLSGGCQREEGRRFLRRNGPARNALLQLRRFGGNISGGIVELKDKNAAVRVERAAGGSPCFFEGFGGQDMGDLRDQARGDESFLSVIALAVDVGINLMRSEERRVGKSVDLGGRRIIKKKKKRTTTE